MPAPVGTFQRPDLGLIFEQFDSRDELGFVGLDIYPVFDVARQSANYSVIPADALVQDGDLTRAPGGGYSRDNWKFDQDNYSTKEYGREERIDDRDRQIYIYSFDLEMVAVERLTMRFLRNIENLVATEIDGNANTKAASGKWSTPASSAPIDDVRASLITLRTNCGLNPRRAIGMCDWETWQYLIDSEQIIQRVKYSGFDDTKRGDMTTTMVARALGLREIYVAGSVTNSADAGQSVTFASIWDKTKFVVAHVAQSNDLRMPCVGRTFVWSGDGSNATGIMEEYREEQTRSQVIRCRAEFHVKTMLATAAIVITGVE